MNVQIKYEDKNAPTGAFFLTSFCCESGQSEIGIVVFP